jgi:indole-3-glycerol phosphate synthase
MGKNFLEEIVMHKKRLLEDKKAFFSSLKVKALSERPRPKDLFRNAIASPGKLNLIAEIKKASPSQGIIRPNFDVVNLAETYSKAGASAISVLTEEKYFLGKPSDLQIVSSRISLPVLTKDFIISEEQICETFLLGSSAVLLIVAILSDKEIKKLIAAAGDFGLDALVEAHSEDEVKRAVDCGAGIIGVNSRNLKTLEVSFQMFERLIPCIPKGTVVVAESGIKDHGQIQILKDLGVNAVLIGETFLREEKIAEKIKEVMNG